MANHTIVSPPNDANQENVAPSADPLANVRSTAREALVEFAHVAWLPWWWLEASMRAI